MLGPEDCGPAAKWISLIRQSLNRDMINPVSKQSLRSSDQQQPYDSIASDPDDQNLRYNSCSGEEGSHRYCLAASKQMVGIFVCVWVRVALMQQISGLKVSCVGRGIMGYLGDKVLIDQDFSFYHFFIIYNLFA